VHICGVSELSIQDAMSRCICEGNYVSQKPMTDRVKNRGNVDLQSSLADDFLVVIGIIAVGASLSLQRNSSFPLFYFFRGPTTKECQTENSALIALCCVDFVY